MSLRVGRSAGVRDKHQLMRSRHSVNARHNNNIAHYLTLKAIFKAVSATGPPLNATHKNLKKNYRKFTQVFDLNVRCSVAL